MSAQRDRERMQRQQQATASMNQMPNSLFGAPIKQEHEDETTKRIKNTLGDFETVQTQIVHDFKPLVGISRTAMNSAPSSIHSSVAASNNHKTNVSKAKIEQMLQTMKLPPMSAIMHDFDLSDDDDEDDDEDDTDGTPKPHTHNNNIISHTNNNNHRRNGGPAKRSEEDPSMDEISDDERNARRPQMNGNHHNSIPKSRKLKRKSSSTGRDRRDDRNSIKLSSSDSSGSGSSSSSESESSGSSSSDSEDELTRTDKDPSRSETNNNNFTTRLEPPRSCSPLDLNDIASPQSASSCGRGNGEDGPMSNGAAEKRNDWSLNSFFTKRTEPKEKLMASSSENINNNSKSSMSMSTNSSMSNTVREPARPELQRQSSNPDNITDIIDAVARGTTSVSSSPSTASSLSASTSASSTPVHSPTPPPSIHSNKGSKLSPIESSSSKHSNNNNNNKTPTSASKSHSNHSSTIHSSSTKMSSSRNSSALMAPNKPMPRDEPSMLETSTVQPTHTMPQTKAARKVMPPLDNNNSSVSTTKKSSTSINNNNNNSHHNAIPDDLSKVKSSKQSSHHNHTSTKNSDKKSSQFNNTSPNSSRSRKRPIEDLDVRSRLSSRSSSSSSSASSSAASSPARSNSSFPSPAPHKSSKKSHTSKPKHSSSKHHHSSSGKEINTSSKSSSKRDRDRSSSKTRDENENVTEMATKASRKAMPPFDNGPQSSSSKKSNTIDEQHSKSSSKSSKSSSSKDSKSKHSDKHDYERSPFSSSSASRKRHIDEVDGDREEPAPKKLLVSIQLQLLNRIPGAEHRHNTSTTIKTEKEERKDKKNKEKHRHDKYKSDEKESTTKESSKKSSRDEKRLDAAKTSASSSVLSPKPIKKEPAVSDVSNSAREHSLSSRNNNSNNNNHTRDIDRAPTPTNATGDKHNTVSHKNSAIKASETKSEKAAVDKIITPDKRAKTEREAAHHSSERSSNKDHNNVDKERTITTQPINDKLLENNNNINPALTLAHSKGTPESSTSSSEHDYLANAKSLKHAADNETDRTLQFSKYLEAVLYFILTGIEYEQRSETNYHQMYKDTLVLFKHIMSKWTKSRPNEPITTTGQKLTVLSYRIQSLLTLKHYRFRLKELYSNERLLRALEPPLAGQASITLPMSAFTAMQRNLSIYQELNSVHSMWQHADSLIEKNSSVKAFFEMLDKENGSLSLNSSLESLVKYVKTGLNVLK